MDLHSRLLCNSTSDCADNRCEMPKDNDSASTSTSSSLYSSRYAEILNCLWIPLLISFSKELNCAKAQTILLPGRSRLDSSRSFSCSSPDPTLYFRPVIGILSHPGDGASGRLNNDSNASYIAASYVKFVESAGARVIPLIYNEPREVLFEKLNLVNGVLFTGGWAKSGLYYEIVQEIFEKILEKNDLGDHFPLVATCLGFELLNMIISKDVNFLERFNAQNQPSTLQFTQNIKIEGTVFQRFPPDLLKKLTTDCIVMQNHQYGVSPEKLQKNPSLSSFFKILTTSADEDGKVYVSTVQARNYPVTGFQWHPEKNAFEWGSSVIPHTEDAVQVTQHVANYFISEARKSLNRPPVRKVLDNLIYNYRPSYCGKAGRGFDEVYIFS
ncbi:gamma-glutamyl hydrolase 2-like isoform X1 [Macadamia integrifolia]|uniref:gamma-glutamyl hydrolase 2-like isoform X1 n=2 Tax=Macadamia integrifolia TaxID=60698 RepID=UPI001C52FAEB|nr:gamma-glutamyl hydrolase 2-like isoform X1 [Macadamia integrifolia]